MALQDVRDLVGSKIKDTAGKLGFTEIDAAIVEAIAIYSKDRPRHGMQILTGDGLAVTFALPTDWEDGFSWIERIEFPVGRQTPEYLDEEDFTVDYRDPTSGVLKIRILTFVPQLNADLAVDYALRHQITETVTGAAGIETSAEADRPAIANLAGAICLLNLAAYYTQTTDSTIAADAVSYRTKGDEYTARAQALRQAYNRHMGISDGVKAASATGDLDVDLSIGWDRFFHGRRSR